MSTEPSLTRSGAFLSVVFFVHRSLVSNERVFPQPLSARGRRWEISNALRRQRAGLELLGDRAIVYFCRTPLRELNRATGTSHMR